LGGAHETGDPMVLALHVLGWLLGDARRADRLLALSGLTADQLRGGIADPRLLAEVLAHLEGHEPDLVAAAEALGVRPEDLISARRRLES